MDSPIMVLNAKNESTEKIPFKVSARAGKLLGRENFSNAEGAIMELVKNAYDADSRNCIVLFDIPYTMEDQSDGSLKKVLNNAAAQILIIDNGEGMSKKVIEDYWMQIGTGNKETDFISKNKRVKTGAKGIGRFALDRLGFDTEMWTVAAPGAGFYWQMDWKQFDNSDQSISDITASLSSNDIDIDNYLKTNTGFSDLGKLDFKTGTILRIANLKDDWHDENIAEVFKALEALIPPKELNIKFDVIFRHQQLPKEFGKVNTAFFNDYDYKLVAKFDAKKLKVSFEMTRNELDMELVKRKYAGLFENAKAPFDLKTLDKKIFKYGKSLPELYKTDFSVETNLQLTKLGSFDLTFYYLKYISSQKEEYPFLRINQKERKSVMDRFGGVKIYRDSFRVRPYGDPHNDWLRLGTRVAQSPAGAGQRIGDWRVRPEQTAAIITVSRKENPLLIDKSDRGALQENETFEVFRNLVIRIIHEFEVDRSRIMNVFYKHSVLEKQRLQDAEIDRRAQVLADQIIVNRKAAEEKIYGSKGMPADLFQHRKEEEERRSYEDTFKDTFKKIENERLEKDNEEIVQVRALASLGLIVSSFSHELKEIKNNADDIVDLAKGVENLVPPDLKPGQEYKDVKNIISSLAADTRKIVHWIEYSLNAIKKDKRKRIKLNLNDYFDSLQKDWVSLLLERNISLYIHKDKDTDYFLQAFEMDMNTIFSNLISNSIDAFDNLKVIRARKIEISIKKDSNFLEIHFNDNGPGLSKYFDSDRESIFQPFVTSKIDGHGKEIGIGLGMYLVKNVMDDYKGLTNILDEQPGFHLKLFFPLRKN